MAKAEVPAPVKLVVGAITSEARALVQAKTRLKKKFGPIDFESKPGPFNSTDYYTSEMGPNLSRQFFSFANLIDPGQLAAIKLYTNRLEARLSPKSAQLKRSINLDPGYISAAKLVLATCKNYAHRIYLDKGIFAEVTLQFHQGGFAAWPWTYPDYQSKEHLKTFTAIRQLYIKQT
ncbi:DUF4416 family protein [Candidatus Omnitrophota bacterium]